MKVPEKLYLHFRTKEEEFNSTCYDFMMSHNDIEYIRTDVFIEKAKKWFEKQNEWFDPNGNRHCDLDDFENFRKYMKGE